MSTLPTPRPSLEIPVTSTRPPCNKTPTIWLPRAVLSSPAPVHPPFTETAGAEGGVEAAEVGGGVVLPACAACAQENSALRRPNAAPRTNHLPIAFGIRL